jgi:Cu/Ag efflux pump CusA
MLNQIVKWSIVQRWSIVIASLLISLWGWRVFGQMPLDVFPSFAPPQVEIQADAPGLAPEEVESLVTRPIESAINGTPGLESLRSASAATVYTQVGWTSFLDLNPPNPLKKLAQIWSKSPFSRGI